MECIAPLLQTSSRQLRNYYGDERTADKLIWFAAEQWKNTPQEEIEACIRPRGKHTNYLFVILLLLFF